MNRSDLIARLKELRDLEIISREQCAYKAEQMEMYRRELDFHLRERAKIQADISDVQDKLLENA